MKNIPFLALSFLFFISCTKEHQEPEVPGQKPVYLNTKSSSSWKYHEVNRSSGTEISRDYTLNSTGEDTTINERTYHIYSTSLGLKRYLNVSGNDYYQYDTIAVATGITHFERLYLKTGMAAGSSWSQEVNLILEGIKIPVKVTSKIEQTGLTRTVEGKLYENTIQVSTRITSLLIPAASLTTDIQSYYAPEYGLIENNTKLGLDYLGMQEKLDISTRLFSAELK